MFQGFKKAIQYRGGRKLRLTQPPVRRVVLSTVDSKSERLYGMNSGHTTDQQQPYQQLNSSKTGGVSAVPSGSSPKLNGSLTKRKTHGDPSSVIWNKAGLNKKMGEEEVIFGSDVDSDSSEDLHYGPGMKK